MATPTTDQGIILPDGPDLAAVVAALQTQVAGLETRLNLRYADAADRTVRHPVGVAGERSDLAAEAWADAFDGTNWISATSRGYRAMKVRTTDIVPIVSSVALVNDAVMVAPIESAGGFRFGGVIFYDAPVAADFKMAFTWPGAPAAVRWGAIGRNVTTTTSLEMPVTSVSGTALPFGAMGAGTPTFVTFAGYIRNTGAAGNLQLQYAPNAVDPGNFTVRAGSTLWVLRTS